VLALPIEDHWAGEKRNIWQLSSGSTDKLRQRCVEGNAEVELHCFILIIFKIGVGCAESGVVYAATVIVVA